MGIEQTPEQIFSINLNLLISRSGKSQKQVAEEMGISPTTFNTWCVGKILPSLKKIQMIADYFDVDKSELIDQIDESYNSQTIAMNLNRLLAKSGKKQSDLSKDLDISKTTLSSWLSGYRIPRMDKIDAFCKYFNCSRADIVNPYNPKEAEILSALEKNIVRNYREADKQHKSIVLLALGLME